ncbi:carbohydrate ABC transporter ATP-binding protein, CUT1 family [Aliiroseovarius halocynthiae]|uniref:ABC transporter ATP-binding protein n=1 Tax=Aliiroseovarius halocynthiae TaxID=985055 RepID=A0A545SS90_9RHOB|nr:ABC transporter ATP-binding protein [Aliiroseovarius halocynthiae]TQV67831.1 ABC transporter ATP-binding protein [Aliiroseovarius halocynthiae]SMR72922.1 carbohydrate ABC transporter ATP-binding protein, CUT1 family [Aliiroseovarius halocynthiae]
MADINLTAVEKHFDGVPALQSITAHLNDGEFVALLGPSGCGKSTLLRLLAGFETPTQGAVSIGAAEVANAATGLAVPPEARNIGFVFQSYALWPHMSVRRNVAYPLDVRGISKADKIRQTDAALAATGLQHYADRMPAELSGGQRQRVALARCLVSAPDAVLLDEPLANLDVALRASMQDVFSDFHDRTGATMVYVTHDQSEAMAMADRIAVMSEGRIVQLDTPEILYNQPRSKFVAGFVGEGTVLPIGDVDHSGNMVQARLLRKTITIKTDTQSPNLICLRPEHISITETGDLRAEVQRCTYLGGRYRLTLHLPDGTPIQAESRDRYALGTQLGVSIKAPWAFTEV